MIPTMMFSIFNRPRSPRRSQMKAGSRNRF
jgi:hypothetical protein